MPLHTESLDGDRLGFDPRAVPAREAHLALLAFVVPRPIAMVSSRSPDGVANVAPFSYFMAVTGRPLTIAVTMGLHLDGQPKDTYRNAIATGEFVVNVTADPIRDDIELAARQYPPAVDEFEILGWTPCPSVVVSAPSLYEAPASLECRVRQVVDIGEPGVVFSQVWIVIAEVLYITLRSDVLDGSGEVDPVRLGAVGSLGGGSYLRTVPEGVYELAFRGGDACPHPPGEDDNRASRHQGSPGGVVS